MSSKPDNDGHRSEDPATFLPRRGDLLVAYAILRVSLGVNILMHGLSRVSNMPGFVDGVAKGFASTALPNVLVRAFAWTISPVEIIVGALVTLGLFTRVGLIAGGLFMIPLIFGTTLRQEWATASMQLNYVLLYFVLLAAASLNRISLDALLVNRK